MISPSATNTLYPMFQLKKRSSSLRQASLPLKKRRLYWRNEEHDAKPEPPSSQLPLLSELDASVLEFANSNTDEQLAVLALVAAAGSFAHLLPSQDRSTPSDLSTEGLSVEDSSDPALDDSLSTKPSHGTPLSKPPPGSCHGRTSRNNSHCRRQPCYNGSKYCKLHYQHYIISGQRSPLEEESEQPRSICVPAHSTTIAALAPHQDRRFTGSGDEVRCQATTTRGRACAYISVSGTKYCYLHADYDTNPPPRRGAGSLKDKVTKTNREERSKVDYSQQDSSSLSTAEASLASHEGSDRSTLGFSPVSAGTEDIKSVKLTSPKTRGRRTPASLAAKHADSPYPLLSMVSTDQWKDQMVRVSCGPLINRIGKVEKWGNGWVTIRIPGVGLHNRRSFELYISSDDQAADIDDQDRGDASLVRCVSREAASPSPAEMESSGSSSKMAVTPSSKRDSDDSLISPPVYLPEAPNLDRFTGSWISPSTIGESLRKETSPAKITPLSPRRMRAEGVTLRDDGPMLSEPGFGDKVGLLPRRSSFDKAR